MEPVELETFMSTFLSRFFSRELRESKLEQLLHLKQGNLSVKEYSLKFTFVKACSILGRKS